MRREPGNDTETGVLRSTVVPSPNLPPPLLPHAFAVPSLKIAKDVLQPLTTLVAPVTPSNFRG